jgi:preprotein translocase subunit Sec61beta
MSGRRSKRRGGGGPMPATGAGLLRFFEEDTPGIEVTPQIVVLISIALIIVCSLSSYFY